MSNHGVPSRSSVAGRSAFTASCTKSRRMAAYWSWPWVRIRSAGSIEAKQQTVSAPQCWVVSSLRWVSIARPTTVSTDGASSSC
eukprot:5854185-Prymnesium_polylepis.1